MSVNALEVMRFENLIKLHNDMPPGTEIRKLLDKDIFNYGMKYKLHQYLVWDVSREIWKLKDEFYA